MSDTFPPLAGSPDGADDWCTVAEAARRLGVTPTAIRNRIKRRTLRVKPNGNREGQLVLVPRAQAVARNGDGNGSESREGNGDDTGSGGLDQVMDVLVAELRGRLAELQARATAAEAERSGIVQQAAQERAQATEERVRLHTAVAEAGQRLTAALTAREADLDRHRREVEELHRELRELRTRPWWQRMWSAA